MSSIFNAIYAFWNQIIYAVAGMRIPFDIIDILLMAYIIYKAIGFLRETRAGQLAKGLVIFVVIYFVANWWNLTTMKWILSRFVDFIIIAHISAGAAAYTRACGAYEICQRSRLFA